MERPPGAAYVYRSYGIHAMFNVVVEPEGQAAAILIRAIEPLRGCDEMRVRRGASERIPTYRLAAGPGNLTQALGITPADDGTDLVESEWLTIVPGAATVRIMTSARIGITRGLEHPWRFFDADSPSVSATKRGALVITS
jgi:DNA-3-methyladenine glycosylase